MRFMLQRGIQASISSDDPGLFGYEGVTLDWAYACGAWALDLRDLKKLSLNGIKYSSVDEKVKEGLYKIFKVQWAKWIKAINEDGEDVFK